MIQHSHSNYIQFCSFLKTTTITILKEIDLFVSRTADTFSFYLSFYLFISIESFPKQNNNNYIISFGLVVSLLLLLIFRSIKIEPSI
mmetsp:Transcript_39318/g.44914  ORF Transcript_39318/g.44914 Transcript_39318/m.44914 type:complete len:87 (-) Transcript_39318:679-939(-)